MKTFIALLLCFFITLPIAHAQRFVKIVGNTNELMAQPAPDVHSVTAVKGYGSSNENRLLMFQLITNSTATPDGIRIFRPTFGAGVGRYHLLSLPPIYETNFTIISTNVTIIATSNLVLVTTNISFVTTNTTNLTWTFITPTATNVFNPTNLFVITNSVPGIGSSTDNAIVRWDGTTGRLIQDSIAILRDDGWLILTDGDVLHPIAVTSSGSFNSFGFMRPLSATAGGLDIRGLSDTAGDIPLRLDGWFANSTDPTDNIPAIQLRAVKYDGGSAGTLIGNAETALQVGNAGTPLMTILGGGNVGIGTVTPTAALHVTGDASISGGVTNTSLTASNIVFTDGNKRLISGAVGSGLTWNGSSLVATGLGGTVTSVAATAPAAGFTISGSPITSSGTFGFLLSDDLAALEGVGTAGVAQRTAANTWSTALGTANYIPKWSAAAPFLTTTSLLFDDGVNVGIGTATPEKLLDLRDGWLLLTDADVVHPIATASSGSFNAFGFMKPISGLGGGLDIRGMSDNASQIPLRIDGWFANSTDPDDAVPAVQFRAVKYDGGSAGTAIGALETGFQFYNLGVELLTILGSGNVGVGTITPDQRLSVNGSISLVGIITNTSGTLQIGAAGGAIQLDPIVTTIGVDGGASSTLRLNSAAGTARDLVYRSGGVTRWVLRANAAAEGGATAGSDFVIVPHDDAGAALATAVTITRASGNVTIPGAITNASLTASSAVFSDANKRLVSTGLVLMTQGGTGVSLTDPGADKLFGWDDTGNTLQFFNIGAGLVYDAATDTLSSTNTGAAGGDFVGPASATDTAFVLFDGVTGKLGKNSVGLLSAGGAMSGIATIDTGQGANELFDMDQNVLTTSAPVFATLDTGQGANELFDMDQNVQTTDTVTFGNLTVTTGITNSSLTINSAVFTDANKRLVSTGLVSLALGGTANALADPGANRVMGWDDTENLVKFLIIGAGLNYDQATDTLTATTTGGDFVGPGSATDEAIVRFDGTTGKLGMNSAVTITDAGAIAGVTTLNTGNGANELFPMDQAVLTTSAVVHTTVDTGQGANELFDMNQNVQTTDTPTFVGLTLSGSPATILALNDFLLAPAGSSLIRLDAAGAGYTSIESAALVTGGLTNSTLTASQLVFSDANKRLISGAIGSGLAYDGTTLTATGLGGTVTGPGTIGRIPKWTGATALGDSIISESSQILTLNGGASTFKTSAGTLTLQGAGQDLVTLGNVGIGTASPASLLNLAGASPELLIRGTANAFETLRGDGNTADSRLFGIGVGPAVGTDALVFSSYLDSGSGKNANLLVLQSGGNVGIATASPTAKLHVTGDASISGSITNSGLTASSPVFTDANKRLVSTGTLSLNQGGTQTSLADPNANRIMGWDDTENLVKFFTIGSGLSYDQATDTLTSTAGGSFGNSTEIQYSDGLGGFLASPGLTFDSSAFALRIGTTLSPGLLRLGAEDVLHNFGLDNIFVGDAAGNFLLSGARNAGLGDGALLSLTSGGDNTAVGHAALASVTSGSQNVAIGAFTGNGITGSSNTLIGAGASLAAFTDVNEIVIGSAVGGKGSNTATIGGVGGSATVLNVNAGQAAALRAKVGGTIHVDTTTVGNFGAGTDDLMSYTLPGGTLAADHDRLVILSSGSYDDTSSKDVFISIDGSASFGGLNGVIAQGRWSRTFEIIRTSATSYAFEGVYQDTANRLVFGGNGTATFSGNVIIKSTASATSDNDVTQTTLSIEWKPAP